MVHVWLQKAVYHEDFMKWKHFPYDWPFAWGNHRWPMDSPHEGQWRGALVFSLMCAWKKQNGWANNRDASELSRHSAHYDITVMQPTCSHQQVAFRRHHNLEMLSAVSYWSFVRDTLQWRHIEHDGVLNHQPHHCLLNRLFRRRSKKTSELRVTGLCASLGNLLNMHSSCRWFKTRWRLCDVTVITSWILSTVLW